MRQFVLLRARDNISDRLNTGLPRKIRASYYKKKNIRNRSANAPHSTARTIVPPHAEGVPYQRVVRWERRVPLADGTHRGRSFRQYRHRERVRHAANVRPTSTLVLQHDVLVHPRHKPRPNDSVARGSTLRYRRNSRATHGTRTRQWRIRPTARLRGCASTYQILTCRPTPHPWLLGVEDTDEVLEAADAYDGFRNSGIVQCRAHMCDLALLTERASAIASSTPEPRLLLLLLPAIAAPPWGPSSFQERLIVVLTFKASAMAAELRLVSTALPDLSASAIAAAPVGPSLFD